MVVEVKMTRSEAGNIYIGFLFMIRFVEIDIIIRRVSFWF